MKITNEDNMALMARYEDNHFDLAIVDPPYGINWDGEKATMVKKHPSNYKKKDWDKSAPNKEYFKEVIRVSKNQIIWGANHFIENIPSANSSCWVIWDKEKGDFSLADGEVAWTSFKTALKIFKWQWHGFIRKGERDKKRIHPTQKPIALYEWLLDNYAVEGDKILDTHLGSGSIAIACHNRKFDLTACELDKDYYIAAMKRLKQHQQQQTLF